MTKCTFSKLLSYFKCCSTNFNFWRTSIHQISLNYYVYAMIIIFCYILNKESASYNTN